MLRRAIRRIRRSPEADMASDKSNDWNLSRESRSLAGRVRKQRSMRNGLYDKVWILRTTLTIVGISWLFLLPLDELGRNTYMDENAVQPAQTTTYWSWNDVHVADRYLVELEDLADRNASSEERAGYLLTEFHKLGISASSSSYNYTSVNPFKSGTNAYVTMSPPRSPGVETVLVSANWKSLTGGWNFRGIATVMSFAKFLRGQNHWAKDFVFVFGDDYIEGIEAFLSSYHGIQREDLDVETLSLAPQGVIWAALNIDYPGHSFSHLGLYYEGVNGVLPNQDLLNAILNIARWTGGVPVQYHSVSDDLFSPLFVKHLPSPLRALASNPIVAKYHRGFRHLQKHFSYAALGTPAGSHGTFAKYRIEGVTLFAEPATGPHGFHALGIVLESTLRSINNLLERLHASFFFYLLLHPGWFVKIGNYLPAAILIGAGLTIGGIRMWVQSGWVLGKEGRWTSRARGLDLSLSVVGVALALGLVRIKAQENGMSKSGIFAMPDLSPVSSSLPSFPTTLIASYVLGTYTRRACKTRRLDMNAIALVLSTTAHLVGGATVTALAMINFPQAVILGLSLTFVLALSQPAGNPRGMFSRFTRLILLQAISPEGLSLIARAVGKAEVLEQIWNGLIIEWRILGNWFVPGFLGVWWVLQVVVCVALWL